MEQNSGNMTAYQILRESRRITDIWLGAGSSVPGKIININGTLFFSANDGINGRELWYYDGISAEMVTNTNPNPFWFDILANEYGSSTPTDLIYVNSILYFVAEDGSYGRELFRYKP